MIFNIIGLIIVGLVARFIGASMALFLDYVGTRNGEIK
ncbi:hypothetical protein bthur0012_55910 [Bacillus thuringiensis serovar pulsiensis BGSC 4CC1]|nr:hypothetical protein bthur0012_55910 [Bacillus thuringiensis serovar pulsiensis BGSC 4CC1]